jgi:hypothetical protein
MSRIEQNTYHIVAASHLPSLSCGARACHRELKLFKYIVVRKLRPFRANVPGRSCKALRKVDQYHKFDIWNSWRITALLSGNIKGLV